MDRSGYGVKDSSKQDRKVEKHVVREAADSLKPTIYTHRICTVHIHVTPPL